MMKTTLWYVLFAAAFIMGGVMLCAFRWLHCTEDNSNFGINFEFKYDVVECVDKQIYHHNKKKILIRVQTMCCFSNNSII